MPLDTALGSSTRPAENAEVRELLGRKAAVDLLNATSFVVGPLARHYFSFTFTVRAETPAGSRSVFVKIPKLDLRDGPGSILPLSSGDRRLAQEEEASLRMLERSWKADGLGVRWVRLHATVPEWNALITDAVAAGDALATFRHLDLRRRFGSRDSARRLGRLMGRLGAALGRYHNDTGTTATFQSAEVVSKVDRYCSELSTRTGSRWPDRVRSHVERLGGRDLPGLRVPTLKGLDIRNVLLDEDDSLILLDPGKTKLTHREADLARFLMTYRVLHWGSPSLAFLGEPDPAAETAFLTAYYDNNAPPRPEILRLFMLKEQLKHWSAALDSLERRRWPPLMTRLSAARYVNPFYVRQVATQLGQL